MKQMGKEISLDESKKMVQELDTNGDGGIDFR